MGTIRVNSKNQLVITDVFKKRSRGAASETTVTGPARKKRFKKIVLNGKWSLTPEYALKFSVTGSDSAYFGKTIILKGELAKAKRDALVFKVRNTELLSGLNSFQIELNGKWCADKNNRITFKAEKSSGRYDVLRFQGAWQVNKKNELIYKYRETSLRRSVKKEKSLLFKGYWELGDKRLTYVLGGAGNSFFEFKAALRTKRSSVAGGAINYRVGIKYSRGKVYRRIRKNIKIYGTWKMGKDLKVGFEILCSGKKHRMNFLIEKLIAENRTLIVSLKSEDGKIHSIKVSFRNTFRDDAELFLALSRVAGENRIVGGVRVKF